MTPELMPGAEPFFYTSETPAHNAVLLVHGFTSSCHSMRELGKRIYENGMDARGILLPGHGTTPDDLATRYWSEWYEAVNIAFLEMKKNYNKVFIAGQSMGGCLALLLAARNRAVDGVVTIASGLKIYNTGIGLVPLVKHFIKHKPKLYGPDVKDERVKQTEVHYTRMPYASIHELLKLLKSLRAEIGNVTCPLLTIHGREDHTFDFRNQDMIYRRVASTQKKKVVLENTYHLATLDFDKTIVQNETINFLKSLC
ncbi:MAG TPA: alpha/beta fold hydrolase [bacterium]|nr:alpha/beta fold hydrolase [bacterium]HND76229.1 alpha/beta fold hydrolase [bacterium]HNF86317.1 alpha/beta fold hydrolase [bacterium]HNH32746.1 alpha/beta fold hydrolase [bacterium]HNM14133.1 alpha/beta fold hydrolase [bacterium]